MEPAVPLGPFDLFEVLGSGAMGVVRRGLHRASGVPVAIKVLTGAGASDPVFVASVHNEVRAFAAIDHPAVVAVYDYGEVPASSSGIGPPPLVAGTPYLAMELVEGGTLAPWRGRTPFPVLRDVLLALLSGLGRAHARGVVHRDLKPANVLVDGALPRVKLTDFGIAHVAQVHADEGARTVSGTPAYMAPEQLRGEWRDFGPWTDLYALGALAWSLATGHPPYAARDLVAAARAHLRDPLPPLRAVVPVPAGFEEWLRTLLAKAPEERFQRAADAASALGRLGVPTRRPTSTPGVALADADTWIRAAPEVDGASPVAGPGATPGPARPLPAPVPADWRALESAAAPAPLRGTGLGLFGLRTVPLVDRDAARDLLWNGLGEASRGRARAVVLRGPAGFGKSRLAQWLQERAHESGSASVWTALHAPVPGPHDGLGPMIARQLRLRGLPAAEAQARVRRTLRVLGDADGADAEALTALALSSAPDAPAVRFESSRERHLVVRRLLARDAAARPVVLVIDDAQWAGDALAFVLQLLVGQVYSPARVLVVATVREEALAERRAESGLLDALQVRADTATVAVGPLDAPDRSALVRGLLGLDPELAARVEQRTAGNPQFAVQLVGDWVQRGLLLDGPQGFRLRPDVPVDLPADVVATWASRVDRLLRGRPVDDEHALELAALLGRDVDVEEWRAVSLLRGVRPSDGLLGAVLRQGLARAEDPDRSFAFVHAMLRETLEHRARAAGRHAEGHRACARVLLDRARAGAAARAGRHLVAAGDVEAASRHLVLGAREAQRGGDLQEALRLAQEAADAIEAAGLPASDARRGSVHVVRAHVRQVLGPEAELQAEIAAAQEGAERHGWDGVLAEAHLLRGMHATRLRRLDEGAGHYERAAEVARRAGVRAIAVNASAGLANVEVYRARQDRALALLRAAEVDLGPDEADDAGGTVFLALGALHEQRREPDEAERVFRRALTIYERSGYRAGRVVATSGLAMVALMRGDLGEADRIVSQAARLAEAVGGAFGAAHRLEVAHVRLAQRDWAGARALAERAAAEFREHGAEAATFLCGSYRLPGLAEAGEWEEYDRVLADVRQRLGTSWSGGVPVAEALEGAAVVADAAGDVERAGAARALAASVWERIGHPRPPANA